MFAFAGPAYLVSVGYMDPGNWATDLEAGARFGYQLLWILLLSNAMAILLQTLSARLGIVAGRDLAQACREVYPRPIVLALWGLCEIAIAACDLAEVLGAAIGLNLLFHIPLLAGVLLTAADTLLVIWFTRFGIRIMESIILAFVSIIGACFLWEILLAKPDIGEMARGLCQPWDHSALYIAIGIIGATVMPHNLYLHSSLVQTRRIGTDDLAKRSACRFNLIDSFIALNGALLINGAILVLAASVFHKQGIVVTEIQQAHQLLVPLLGTSFAGVAFAIALLCSGQSSTITGTMAGQIVMEGFLDFRMRPWLRRLITRSAAVIPAAITIWLAGDQGTYRLLILSQVILSMQLPFAVVPLIQFTSDSQRMRSFRSPRWLQALAWASALLIIALNVRLVFDAVVVWGQSARWLGIGLGIVGAGLAALLLYITVHPWLRGKRGPEPPAPVTPPVPSEPVYQRILVPLDHSGLDQEALTHAISLARIHKAHLYLMHVEEDVASQVYGSLAETAEIERGRHYFAELLDWVRKQGIEADLQIVYGKTPKEEILRLAQNVRPDLLVMGAHGHKGLKDIIFGATINEVRHRIDAPVLIVKGKN
jgi:manganese transport protein